MLPKKNKKNAGTNLRMSFKIFDANDLHHEQLLTIRQKIAKLRNAFNDNMSTEIKLSKAQISKITKSAGFLGSLLSKIASPLMKVIVPLAKNILTPLEITAAASTIHPGVQKEIHGPYCPSSSALQVATVIILNKE